MIGVLIGFGVLLFFLYWLNRRKMSYWERRGVSQMNPLPLIGNMLGVYTCQYGLVEFYCDTYKKFKGKNCIGYYNFWEPFLMVIDPDLIERILVKDFSSFVNRGFPQGNPKNELGFQLPQLTDSLWRGIRYKMTPAFSTGKLKLMFDNMQICVTSNLNYLESLPKDNVNIKDISTRFTMDVIASTAFGLDVSKEADASSEFRTMGTNIIQESSIIGYLIQLFALHLPKLAEFIGFNFPSEKVGAYFTNIIKDTMRNRIMSGEKRQDLIDHLITLKKQEIISVHKDPEDKYLQMDNVNFLESFVITDSMLISQAFTFISAGFDGLSTLTVLILYELASNLSYQDRVREELREHTSKQDGAITYAGLRKCSFLEKCIHEGLRMYPFLPFLMRQASRDFEIEPGVTIEAGTRLVISVDGLHRDPDYWTDPDIFHPDRFSSELTTTISEFTYIPFGGGPRMCIAMRMSVLVAKLFIASLLAQYEVHLSAKCPRIIRMKYTSLFNSPEDGLTFSLVKIRA